MNNRDTGKFIAEMRKEKGLTQKDLAEKLNITDKAVSKWETGKSAPDISNLVPLSEILDVSVVEILQGKKIEKESYQSVSDEVVISTIKKDVQARKRSVIATASIIFSLAFIAVIIFFSYHFLISAPADNDDKIIKKASQYTSDFFEQNEEIKITKSVKKSKYYFYLLQGKKGAVMVMFESDKIFNNRIHPTGGSSVKNQNEIALYCTGESYETINVFFGFDMTEKQYSYFYRGVKSTKEIKEKYILDVIIDLDDSFTNAEIIYS